MPSDRAGFRRRAAAVEHSAGVCVWVWVCECVWVWVCDVCVIYQNLMSDLKPVSCPFSSFRRNWKRRYFALRGKTLFYYSESDLSTAKPNGAIDLKDVT